MRLDVYVKGVATTTKKRGVGSAGGWAAIGVVDGEVIFRRSGSRIYSIAYKMELLAAVMGAKAAERLRARRDNEITECHVYSENSILIKCYEYEWWRQWVKYDWVKYDGTPIKYEDIWRELLPYFKNRCFGFHLNTEQNKYKEMAEQLAWQASTKMKNNDEQ